MNFGHKLNILLMDNSSWWIPIMKKGLELMAPEFRIMLAETEAEAIEICMKESVAVVLMDPQDFQSVYLIRLLQKIRGERLYILLISKDILLEQRKIHQSADNVLLLLRPCSFKTVYQNIRDWVYGKKQSFADDICYACLKRWGFTVSSLGFRYLCDAFAEYALERRQPMKAVYATLETRFGNSEKNIQNAIRAAVKNAWKTGQMAESFSRLPNNREILNTICKELDKRA